MDPESLMIWAAIGAIAGFIAGLITQGGGFGLISNIVVGILGAVVSAYFFPRLNISIPIADPIFREIVVATIGAVVLLLVLGVLRRE